MAGAIQGKIIKIEEVGNADGEKICRVILSGATVQSVLLDLSTLVAVYGKISKKGGVPLSHLLDSELKGKKISIILE